MHIYFFNLSTPFRKQLFTAVSSVGIKVDGHPKVEAASETIVALSGSL